MGIFINQDNYVFQIHNLMANKMSNDTKLVQDLQIDESVMYKGKIYAVVQINEEFSLRRVKLVSLTLPREIISVAWHPESVITFSPLISKTYQLIKHTEKGIFEAKLKNGDETILCNLNGFGMDCIKAMAGGSKVFVVIHICFDSQFIGNRYFEGGQFV